MASSMHGAALVRRRAFGTFLGLFIPWVMPSTRAFAETTPIVFQSSAGDAALELESSSPGPAAPRLPCGSRCTLTLSPGEYFVSVTDGRGYRYSRAVEVAGRPESERGLAWPNVIVIDEPSHVTLTPPSHRTRKTGEILKMAGSVIGGVGGLLTVYGGFKVLGTSFGCAGDCGEEDDRARLMFAGGLIGMVAGAAVAMTGAVLVATNNELEATVQPLRNPREARAGRGGLVPVVGPRAWGLALTGRF